MYINNSRKNPYHQRKEKNNPVENAYNNGAKSRNYNFRENRPQNRNDRNNPRLNQRQYINMYQEQTNRYLTKMHNNHKYRNINVPTSHKKQWNPTLITVF